MRRFITDRLDLMDCPGKRGHQKISEGKAFDMLLKCLFDISMPQKILVGAEIRFVIGVILKCELKPLDRIAQSREFRLFFHKIDKELPQKEIELFFKRLVELDDDRSEVIERIAPIFVKLHLRGDQGILGIWMQIVEHPRSVTVFDERLLRLHTSGRFEDLRKVAEPLLLILEIIDLLIHLYHEGIDIAVPVDRVVGIAEVRRREIAEHPVPHPFEVFVNELADIADDEPPLDIQFLLPIVSRSHPAAILLRHFDDFGDITAGIIGQKELEII